MTRLYVGNLAWGTTEAALKAHFEPSGPVKFVKIVVDRDTGRSKGFAFVEMETPEAAQTALQLNNTTLDGRAIRVNEALPPQKRDNDRGGFQNFDNRSSDRGGRRDSRDRRYDREGRY